MLGLTSGELFVVLFILFAVVSAPWWPRLGEAVARALLREKIEDSNREQPENGDDE